MVERGERGNHAEGAEKTLKTLRFPREFCELRVQAHLWGDNGRSGAKGWHIGPLREGAVGEADWGSARPHVAALWSGGVSAATIGFFAAHAPHRAYVICAADHAMAAGRLGFFGGAAMVRANPVYLYEMLLFVHICKQ